MRHTIPVVALCLGLLPWPAKAQGDVFEAAQGVGLMGGAATACGAENVNEWSRIFGGIVDSMDLTEAERIRVTGIFAENFQRGIDVQTNTPDRPCSEVLRIFNKQPLWSLAN